MTEAMPFLQKTILLSYDPRPSCREFFSPIHRRPCMKPSIAVAWMSPPMTRLR